MTTLPPTPGLSPAHAQSLSDLRNSLEFRRDHVGEPGCRAREEAVAWLEAVDAVVASVDLAWAETARLNDCWVKQQDTNRLLWEALKKIAYLRPGGPTTNNLVMQMERIAIDAMEGKGQ